jgi:hypothetical protein
MSIAIAIALVGIGVVGLMTILAIYGGVVFWLMWGWFMVPLGLPQIGIAWAIGLSTIVVLVTPTVPNAPQGERTEHLTNVLGKPAFALLIGWVAKQFM